jgi:hypothetical protein
MPEGAQLPFETDVWLPLSQLGPDLLTNRVRHPLEVVARLKPGATLTQARGEMETIAGRLQQTYPATNKTIGVTLAPLRSRLTVRYERDIDVRSRPRGQILVIGLTVLAVR